MYFQPMAPGYNKVFNRPFDEFWCCTGTGMENFSKLGDNIYYTEGSNVYVHMFFSSSYTDAKNNLTITQTANMPNEDTVTFTLAAADGGSIKASTVLRLRRPDWLAGEAVIKVNGKEITLEEENGYYNVKNLKAGDEISYKMPMTVQVYDMPDNPNLVAFKYGPVVLSAGLGSDNIERSAANGILVRVGTLDPDAKTTILMENYTDVEEWKADVEENVVRIEDSEDGQVQFKLKVQMLSGGMQNGFYVQKHKLPRNDTVSIIRDGKAIVKQFFQNPHKIIPALPRRPPGPGSGSPGPHPGSHCGSRREWFCNP